MLEFEDIELTHANLNTPVSIRVGSIGGHHFSEQSKCTYVYTISGVFPVTETSEEIRNIIKQKRGNNVKK